MRILMIAPPGAGKGTQGALIAAHFDIPHIATGELLRDHVARRTALGQAVQAYLDRGELVPDTTVWAMVRERKGCLQCVGGFVLDGFPRTLAQAESLKELLDAEGLKLSGVVNYSLRFSEIVARLGGRRTCEKCKAVFHLIELPPKIEGRCNRCDGKLFQREDDRPESIKIRMEAYDRSTAPLIAFYKNLGLLTPVPATGSPEEICARTLAALGLKQ